MLNDFSQRLNHSKYQASTIAALKRKLAQIKSMVIKRKFKDLSIFCAILVRFRNTNLVRFGFYAHQWCMNTQAKKMIPILITVAK